MNARDADTIVKLQERIKTLENENKIIKHSLDVFTSRIDFLLYYAHHGHYPAPIENADTWLNDELDKIKKGEVK